MGKNDRFCVVPCDNDKRYPDKIKKRSHVVKSYRFPKNDERRQEWIKMIRKGKLSSRKMDICMFKTF